MYDMSVDYSYYAKKVSDKSCRENEKAHFIFNKFFSENLALYEIMLKIPRIQTSHR
jgi:hypothetical protein